MNDNYIPSLHIQCWAHHSRQIGMPTFPGWVITLNHPMRGLQSFYCVIDDFGYLQEVPAP